MQTLVLAAGEGTRIRPLATRMAKPMLPVADRPLSAHTAATAVAAGATELVFVVGYEADSVREYFGECYRGVPVAYAVQEEQTGTADAVRAAREHLDPSSPFAVLNGDNLYDENAISRLYDSGPAVGVFRSSTPSNYGVLRVEDGRVLDVVEKPETPPSNLVNAGAYVFPAETQQWLDVPKSDRGERELTDVLSRVADHHEVAPVELNRWLDVGRPWELLEANEWKVSELDTNQAGEISPDARLEGNVGVEPGAVVEAGAVIEGPALIRTGATVGPNAYVRGATLIGPGAEIGHAVEIKNSVLMADASVNHLSYVGDSVLGRAVNLGAGTTVANLRHDSRPIELAVKGEQVSTGRRKFGVVLGPGAKTGINTSLNPGVRLSAGATTMPGEVVMSDR